MRNKRIIGTFHYNKSGLGYVVSKTDEETFVVPLVVSARDGVFDGDTVEIICPPEGAYLERGGYGKLIRKIRTCFGLFRRRFCAGGNYSPVKSDLGAPRPPREIIRQVRNI